MTRRSMGRFGALAVATLATGALVAAQTRRPASPAGSAATEVSGHFVQGQEGPVYRDGKWIEMTFGRPIKRGRDLFGSGATYGKDLNGGAPVWRAGANFTTRLKTEVPLVIAGKTVPPGEYSVFIDLKGPKDWTFIVSSWPAQTKYDPGNKAALWGAFGYTPDKDVVRAPMKVAVLDQSIDQLAWEFVDMTNDGGSIAIVWDKTMASVPFKVGK